eukprot:TRINITY_DN24457_c0_g1_i1.p1 TRINITY_DN24457_c0_g1~~TRINITY_DN24457_c0_g1_i1.p1  ORF type:complete len:755 (-),score=169.90 TRINITY_DN24457_c0_g1_i1:137-2401(-)
MGASVCTPGDQQHRILEDDKCSACFASPKNNPRHEEDIAIKEPTLSYGIDAPRKPCHDIPGMPSNLGFPSRVGADEAVLSPDPEQVETTLSPTELELDAVTVQVPERPADQAATAAPLEPKVLAVAEAVLPPSHEPPALATPQVAPACHAPMLAPSKAQAEVDLLRANSAPAPQRINTKQELKLTKQENNRLIEENEALKQEIEQVHQSQAMVSMKSRSELEVLLEAARQRMKDDCRPLPGSTRPANRYGTGQFTAFVHGRDVPVLALINPMSGAMAGYDILAIARQTPYYEDRFFNIIDVVRGAGRGGLLDVFRIELNKAKDEAKKLGTRPRLISGGGDGTGSFALFIIFLALKADAEREDEGLRDSGNGFIWTDSELEESFPAIAQMPLGSANDFGHILGWGQKYPGDNSGLKLCYSRESRLRQLIRWIEAIVHPKAPVVNFDVWGIMPPKGEKSTDFKLAELTGKRGFCPKQDGNLLLREAGKPVPFFICLYFSAGFGAYMTARFQINRHRTPITNRVEYIRQAAGIIVEPTPPQMETRLDGVEIDAEGEAYFPPRREKGTRGRGYREVGFYNINWQANALHGYDRASARTRLNPCNSRRPVTFNDGTIDLFRWKFASLLKNPGLRIQTDKKKELELRYAGGHGKGVFFQWDGEARFAFSPTAKTFNIHIRQVLQIPVVLGPEVDARLTGDLDNGKKVGFHFFGETAEDREEARRRTLRSVAGELESELNATTEEIRDAGFVVYDKGAEGS